MSMTREEAIEYAESKKMSIEALAYNDDCKYGNYAMYSGELSFVNAALSALRPVSREQVEKVWRGEWQMVSNGSGVCSKCHRQDKIDPLAKFCRYCGAPMTDEAVEMILKRMEEIYK